MPDDIRSALAEVVEDPPEDLVGHFASSAPKDPRLCTKILGLQEAIRYTRAIQERTLIGKPMGLFALDDSNDSNPFCYITRGPARGCILHLYHDGDTAVSFPSLRSFLQALKLAAEKDLEVWELPGIDREPKVDQEILAGHINQLIVATTDEAECELTILVRLVDTSRLELVQALARHPSFFVREVAAELIAAHPQPQFQAIAEALAGDIHGQVARPGKAALSAVKRLIWTAKKDTER